MAKKGKEKKKTPCEEGNEMLLWSLAVAGSSIVDVAISVCFANAIVRAWVEPVPKGDRIAVIDEEGQSRVTARLPSLPVGDYQIVWSIQTPSDTWQTKVEVSVDDTKRFVQKKSSDSKDPINRGTLGLEVQS